jgi:hypothetical protein
VAGELAVNSGKEWLKQQLTASSLDSLDASVPFVHNICETQLRQFVTFLKLTLHPFSFEIP